MLYIEEPSIILSHPPHEQPRKMPATAPPTAKSHSVPGYHTFIPANPQPVASLIRDTKTYPQNGGKIPKVFQELVLRGTVFKNRLFAVCFFRLFCQARIGIG
jgi:hypothetical protein